MRVDAYIRAVLTVIAVCLVLLVARSFGLGPAETPEVSSRPRFQVANVRLGRAPTLLRLDSETGEVWRYVTRNGVGRWDALVSEAEPEPEPAGEAAPEGAPEAEADAPAAPAPPRALPGAPRRE